VVRGGYLTDSRRGVARRNFRCGHPPPPYVARLPITWPVTEGTLRAGLKWARPHECGLELLGARLIVKLFPLSSSNANRIAWAPSHSRMRPAGQDFGCRRILKDAIHIASPS